jgi:NADH-quinone oxidoreductase subunit M
VSLLAALLFLPLLGALAVALMPTRHAGPLRAVALATTGVAAALGVLLVVRFDGSESAAQFAASAPWFVLPGTDIAVRFQLGVDGISILLVALTAILMPIVVLSSYSHVKERVKEFLVWLLVMETGMLGVFLSLDLVLFYFFWELSLVPLYFLIGIWGSERRLYATIKFFLYTLAGSLVMLVGVIALIYRLESTDVALLSQRAAELPLATQTWIFLAFALAFAIKVPLLPFHTWLADAHTEAPASGSVLLAGVLLKMGTYGLVRFGIGMFPAAAVRCAPLFLVLGAAGIVYGALLAMAQTDLKRLIACSSVSHLGYVVLGLFALTRIGIAGGMLQMVNHGLSTGLLFLLVGMLYDRRHTRALDRFGGLASVMPLFGIFFVVSMLSSVGLPGLNGFVGEYMILLGTFQASPLAAAVGVSGVILGAVYLLKATRKLLFGPVVHAENRALRDLNPREVVLMVPLVLLCVWIGLRPDPLLRKTEGSLELLQERIDDARGETALGLMTPGERR